MPESHTATFTWLNSGTSRHAFTISLTLNCINVSSSLMQRTGSLEPDYREGWKISPKISYPRLDSAREVKKAQKHMYTSLAFSTSDIRPTPVLSFNLFAGYTEHFLKSPLSLFHLPSNETATSSALLSPTPHNPGLLRNSASES